MAKGVSILAPLWQQDVPKADQRSRDLSSCVLIVDDDADLLETLARLMGRFGHKCLVAASGAEAIALIDTASPDLVVTDLHMPGLDGVAVTRRAREKNPPIPVVLMTAYPTPETNREVRTVGWTICVAKPFANADMLDAVQRALGSNKSVVCQE
jgi:CheY-like chemotaxis protein